MSDESTKKRMTMRAGLVMGMQEIDENGVVLQDYVVNTWGGSYFRMDQEEAVLFQQRLNDTCGADLDALIAKVRGVAVEFGLETLIGVPPEKPGNSKK
jgi:arginine decarboxylase-like protein